MTAPCAYDLEQIRAQFPALASGPIHFDNPGGTQVARQVIDRMNDYLVRCNANSGGGFRTAAASDSVIHEARLALADFLGASSPDEIVFGNNMTSLTFSMSRALGRTLAPGDEIVVTRLDHDANIAPWLLMAEDRGAVVRWVDIHPEDCTLDMDDFGTQINSRTKIVACGCASNSMGTINDVATIVRMSHAVGALCFVDAVQYAPHGVIDVAALDCDFLVCSAYKFFGPHIGVLYGKYDLLERLPAYKVRPASDKPPGKFQTGTQNHEGIAGALGAVEFFQWLGSQQGSGPVGRREVLIQALTTLAAYERQLAGYLIAGLHSVPGLKIWGITDPARMHQRVPTVSFTLEGWHPRRLAERLGEMDICVWDGNHYALAVSERLGLVEQGGTLRVGLAHYNTREEVDRLFECLSRLGKQE